MLESIPSPLDAQRVCPVLRVPAKQAGEVASSVSPAGCHLPQRGRQTVVHLFYCFKSLPEKYFFIGTNRIPARPKAMTVLGTIYTPL